MTPNFRGTRSLRAACTALLAFTLAALPAADAFAMPQARTTTRKPVAKKKAPVRKAPARKASGKKPVRRIVPRRPVGPPPPTWTSPRGLPALTADLMQIANGSIRGGKFGVMAVSLTRSDTLFAQNAGEMMQPASTMKLFATAVALDRFGGDHTFSTDVLRDGTVGADGTLAGNLYLRADGDPSMSSRFFREANHPMTTLARAVAAAGVKQVTGDLIYDATAFDDRRIPEGWKTTYLSSAYAAPISALSLNENLVWVVVSPSGGTAQVALEPASTAIPLRSNVRLIRGSGGRIIARRAGDGGIDVSGTIGSSSGPRRYSLVVNDPAPFTAGALHAALQAAGVTVTGTLRPAKTPASATKIASFASPPLSRILSDMNRESVNLIAELVYRAAARAVAPDGMSTAEVSLTNLREFMRAKVGADPQTIRVYDGSGLSTLDYYTPRSMIQLLSYAHRGPWSSAFHASLPVAGESELLRRRMRGTPAEGNLHAKTGTTNSVAALGGYVTAKGGEIIAFAFIYNGNDRAMARAAMDAMGATLANFVRE